jgi:hypothetical protein
LAAGPRADALAARKWRSILDLVSTVGLQVRLFASQQGRATQHLVGSNHAIPNTLMRAYPDERVRAQALKNNVVCYLAKPSAADGLLACVRSTIQRGRRSTD